MAKSDFRKENEAQAIELKLRKKYQHGKWTKRQEEFHKIIERDCYGYKRKNPTL